MALSCAAFPGQGSDSAVGRLHCWLEEHLVARVQLSGALRALQGTFLAANTWGMDGAAAGSGTGMRSEHVQHRSPLRNVSVL